MFQHLKPDLSLLCISRETYSRILYLDSALKKGFVLRTGGTNYFTEVSFSSDLEKLFVSEMLKLEDHSLSAGSIYKQS